jgi:hypothetical protein
VQLIGNELVYKSDVFSGRCPVPVAVGVPTVMYGGFPQSFQANVGILSEVRPRQFPSTYLPIHHSLITLHFDAI